MEFELKGIKFKVEFILNKRKRGWSIKYKAPDTFLLQTNKMMTDEEIYLEMSKHYRFIKRCMTTVDSSFHQSIHLFGIEYELQIIKSDLRKMILMGNKAILYTDTIDKEINQKIVDSFYKENLSYFVNNHIELAKAKMNILFPIQIEYKKVKTYYGECFPKRRLIIFQESLAKYNEEFILSVIYHELCHFYYPNHQKAFYDRLEEVFPGYKSIQARLRRTKYNDMY